MKSKNIFKVLFALVALICIGIGVYGACSGSDAMGMLAAAPIVATFNPANLKMPMSEFEALQAKYGRLYVLDVEIDKDEKHQFVVRRPTRDMISAIASNKNDLTKANDIIINNMVVGGDMTALDDGVVFAQVLKQLGGIVKQGNSFLTKA